MNTFKGQVAIVTGGGRGVGRGIALALAAEGARLVVAGRTEGKLLQTVAEIERRGGTATAVVCDVMIAADIERCVRAAVDAFGRLDILVNNAGIVITGSVEDATLDEWRKTQCVNLDAVFLGTREAIRVMKTQGGSIINISSIEGIIGDPITAAYNAS